MPTLVLDEPRDARANLGANDTAHASVARRYTLETLGYPVWGVSPSATPSGVGYGEYGVRMLGSLGYPSGAVTPHASALALVVTPVEAVANLRRLVNVVSYARRMAATACGSRRCSVTLMLSNDGFGSGATPWRAVKNAGDEAIGLTIGRGVTELIAWGPRAPAMQ